MMLEPELSLHDSTPDPLFEICLDYIVTNIETITEYFDETVSYRRKFKDDVVMPAEICDRLLLAYQNKFQINDELANIFRDRKASRLQSVRIRNATITDIGLRYLLKHKPYEIELTHCRLITARSVDTINRNSQNLVSLKLGQLSRIVADKKCLSPDYSLTRSYLFRAPKLRRLVLYLQEVQLFSSHLDSLKKLTHLELFECALVYPITGMKNLTYLVLHGMTLTEDNEIKWIQTLQCLRHLDISQSNEKLGIYKNPNKLLDKIVTSLPHLQSLDISGTNLAGTGAAAAPLASDNPAPTNGEHVIEVLCDIPGLLSRASNPLHFLGLYYTHHGACKRHDIPAVNISGDANEEQILTAARAYMDRPAMLTRVLNDLYYLFRYEINSSVGRALIVILDAMDRHVSEKHIQISGSATLFYIVKGREKERIGVKLKRRIISALLEGMEEHLGDDTMMRNGCLTLCQFKIPYDVLFEYERVVQILLSGVSDVNQESFVQRIAIYLLNSLACQVEGKQKQFLGNHGAIAKMLNLISDRLDRRLCDDVLEVAWSTMWNVTDETPQNCQRFLDNRGMDFFLACLKNFPDKEELLRNMMGLLGNIAEVASLRPQLMNKLFLTVFYDLLDSSSDGIEVSYNAAGVLAHLASDGPLAWTISEPSREDVLDRLASTVDRWDLRTERNINYRSFEPILSLLHAHHTPQCQHWAVWALANLTTVYPEKYCSVVELEGGLTLLQQLLKHPAPYDVIKELARVVIDNCRRHEPASDGQPSHQHDN